MIEQNQDKLAVDHILLFAELKAGHSDRAREIGKVCVCMCMRTHVCVHVFVCVCAYDGVAMLQWYVRLNTTNILLTLNFCLCPYQYYVLRMYSVLHYTYQVTACYNYNPNGPLLCLSLNSYIGMEIV